ncbi:hypothetical protein P3X46_009199 [Hevea brasiliensis]|uniref:Uncharacterized protein n=1 Tax=Hevea brasiliensis TaxID=3981 RepID=A0ABQ9MM65_HEVBR|nr:UPF0481 protein At3g47200-like [Hevea brasiliensis]KAJ9181023.1 hypothetical protein P3X46_009199 [Hevea brasiliensis]
MSSDAISNVEVQATNVVIVKPEADQAGGSHDLINVEDEASGSHDQPIEETKKLSIVIHGKPTTSKILRERLDSLNQPAEKPVKSLIHKVPSMLRENKEFEKHYEPRVVAIGPIHHGRLNFDYAETMKHKLAGQFMEERGIDPKALYNKIMKNLKILKSCYEEDVIKCYSDDELAWMFLVDGCGMLHFIHCIVKDDGKLQKLNIKKDQVAFAQRDMFLLENQLPFEILELLMNSVVQNTEKDGIREAISEFVCNICDSLITTEHSATGKSGKKQQSCHLLELLREELIANFAKTGEKTERNKNGEPHSFRNVKELIASGILLKPTGERSLNIFFERSFLSRGILRLPSLIVDDTTAPKLKNIIALEMCPHFLNDFQVTSYICFLDSLIDHPEDVQELRKAKILTNCLGSDEEVAKLFNEIGTDLVPNPDLYAKVKADIHEHYKNRCKPYLAEAYHTYFSSPWTFLAFLGALLALLFSAVQAYFSFPSEKS